MLARSYLDWLAAAMVVLGVVVRVRQYAFRRSLWLDEAMVALNIGSRGFRGLLRPLALNQAAPVGWLWLEHGLVRLFGNNEYSQRLVSLLAGIGVLVLLWHVARQLLPRWLVPVVLLLAATSPSLIRYSNEAKQYESDGFAGLVLLAAALPLLPGPGKEGERPSWRRFLLWGGLGAVSVWCSHPAVLVLGGLAGVLCVLLLARRDWPRLTMLVWATAIWGGSFVAFDLVSLRALRGNDKLAAYWRSGFAPWPLRPSTLASWLAAVWRDLVHTVLGYGPLLLVGLLLLAGCVALLRRRPLPGAALLLLAMGPPFLAAAALHLFPLQGRLALVLVPMLLVVLASAAAWHGSSRPALIGRVTGLVLLAVLVVPPATSTVALVVHPMTYEELRPVLQYVQAHRQQGDLVWVQFAATPAFSYYRPMTGVRSDRTMYFTHSSTPCPPTAEAMAPWHGRRIWLVFAHQMSTAPANERAIFLSRFNQVGTMADHIQTVGAAAYLYDLGHPSHSSPELPYGNGDWCLRTSTQLLSPAGPVQI